MDIRKSYTDAAALLGRVLLSALFLISGFGKIAAPAATKAYIAMSGMPLPVDLAYAGAVIVEVGFGLALLAGWRSRPVALVMAIFALVTGLAFHATHLADQDQMIHFLKNISIAGGLLQVVAYGAGRFSLDGLMARPAQR